MAKAGCNYALAIIKIHIRLVLSHVGAERIHCAGSTFKKNNNEFSATPNAGPVHGLCHRPDLLVWNGVLLPCIALLKQR